jgi:hypothetical protein
MLMRTLKDFLNVATTGPEQDIGFTNINGIRSLEIQLIVILELLPCRSNLRATHNIHPANHHSKRV